MQEGRTTQRSLIVSEDATRIDCIYFFYCAGHKQIEKGTDKSLAARITDIKVFLDSFFWLKSSFKVLPDSENRKSFCTDWYDSTGPYRLVQKMSVNAI